MDLLHRLTRYLETKRVEGEVHRRLARLDDRNLADIDLARGDIGRFARAAARPDGSPRGGRSPCRDGRPRRPSPGSAGGLRPSGFPGRRGPPGAHPRALAARAGGPVRSRP
jgi:uncharacterized protein YjiS (DUF1127 family)